MKSVFVALPPPDNAAPIQTDPSDTGITGLLLAARTAFRTGAELHLYPDDVLTSAIQTATAIAALKRSAVEPSMTSIDIRKSMATALMSTDIPSRLAKAPILTIQNDQALDDNWQHVAADFDAYVDRLIRGGFVEPAGIERYSWRRPSDTRPADRLTHVDMLGEPLPPLVDPAVLSDADRNKLTDILLPPHSTWPRLPAEQVDPTVQHANICRLSRAVAAAFWPYDPESNNGSSFSPSVFRGTVRPPLIADTAAWIFGNDKPVNRSTSNDKSVDRSAGIDGSIGNRTTGTDQSTKPTTTTGIRGIRLFGGLSEWKRVHRTVAAVCTGFGISETLTKAIDFVLQQFIDASSDRVSIRIWRTMYLTAIDDAGILRERGALLAITPYNQTIDSISAILERTILPFPYNRPTLLRRYQSGKSQLPFQMVLEGRRLPFRLVAGFDGCESSGDGYAVRPVLTADVVAGPGLLAILNGPSVVPVLTETVAAEPEIRKPSSSSSSSISSSLSTVSQAIDDRPRASSWPGWLPDRVENGTTTIAALLSDDADSKTVNNSWSDWSIAAKPIVPDAAAISETYDRLASIGAIVKPADPDVFSEYGS